jgi:membrane-bound lytic murein transglycosylase B
LDQYLEAIRLAIAMMLAHALVQSAAADQQAFDACLKSLQSSARDQAVPESVVEEVLGSLEFQPRVIELDRDQPEFRQSFSAYLRARVNETRVRRGRELLTRHRKLLDRLTREYGVPGHYLVSFWGMETSFGAYLGSMPTLDSLATLACDPRRSAFFTAELITALKLLHREGLAPERMRGSWAGAMGHTQFMPSSYMRHAVDGDGDGTIDLWNSEADALTSAANYLAELGWETNAGAGRCSCRVFSRTTGPGCGIARRCRAGASWTCARPMVGRFRRPTCAAPSSCPWGTAVRRSWCTRISR